MKLSFSSPAVLNGPRHYRPSRRNSRLPRRAALAGAVVAVLVGVPAFSQVITIDSEGRPKTANSAATVDRRFAQIEPTKVPLTQSILDPKTRFELIRVMQSEQGFAMRPFPRGHKGLTLVANGKLEPAGEAYLNMVTAEGLSAKPGDRVVLTDIKFDHNKIVFDLNGGPDQKHRFMRHIQLGTGPNTIPVVQDDGQEVVGSRLTLTFKDHVPELTGADVKALLSPLISFDVKTPVQAFTDTLPPLLKKAILDHRVMVGMSTEMVLFSLGAPDSKTREMDGQMPFEEWIYGRPPKPVQFVRINGNRVIRLEVAKVGEAPQIFTKDEVEGLMRTDGSPLIVQDTHTRTAAMGDTTRDPNTQAPAAPPTLRGSGETLPQDKDPDSPGAMKPVQFPDQKPDDYPDASRLPRTPAQADDKADPSSKPAQPPDKSDDKTDASTKQPDKTDSTAPASPPPPPPPANPPSQP